MTWFIDGTFFVLGGAFIWVAKDFLIRAIMGTESLVASLRAKASALEAAIKK